MPQQATFFEAKIRPLLFAKCFSCHGDALQAGGLRLDSRAAILKGNLHGPAVLTAEPEKSPILRVIHYDGAIKMPPVGKLSGMEIAALTAWVKMGAPWPETKVAPAASAPAIYVITPAQKGFWSFRPVRKPTLPKVTDTVWGKSPIDRFILAGLEAKGLKPAPPADKHTLIRRVYFDLIGLPPTPEAIAAFIKDTSPNAYAKVVDSLLASPQYGERWGRHWLDVARYSDSNGLDENIAFGNAFRYRDYVIDAFNKDKPYNQFIQEQLAGDQLPPSDENTRNERLVATGFLSLGPKVLAEPDKAKLEMDIIDEQIEVTSKAFLGLTVACARCHNHKFDPIPTKDYYGLAGIFKSTRTMETLNTVARLHQRPLMTAALQQQKDAYDAKHKTAQEALKSATDAANAELLAELHKNGEKYLLAGWEMAHQPALRTVAETPVKAGEPARQIIEAENFDRGNVFKDFVTYGKGIGVIINTQSPDVAEWDITVPTAGSYQIEMRYASAEERPVKLSLNGVVIRDNAAGTNTGSFQPEGQRWEVEGIFAFHAGKNTLRIDCAKYIPHFDKLLVVSADIYGKTPPRSADELAANTGLRATLIAWFAERLKGVSTLEAARKMLTNGKDGLLALPEHPEKLYADATRQEFQKQQMALTALEKTAPVIPMALAVEDDKIENVRVHIRGSTQNLGEEAPRHFLTVLDGDKVSIDAKRSGRLELAQWLTRPENPLTSRVAVNRIWQAHFGEALVRTPDNWGLLGDRPANPQLLDWLAATFMEDGWSFKKMHRRILLSSAYQMSSVESPKGQLADPDNRLVWHMPRRRLEAEPYRDAILMVSGTLDKRLGGSLLTSNDNDYITNDQSGNLAGYDSPRRSIYLPVIRNALYDMFQAFDFGDPSMTHAQRATTTVAPQALYILNSPFVLGESKHFATNLLAQTSLSDEGRIRLAYQRAFGRSPSLQETKRVLGYMGKYASLLAPIEPDVTKRRLRTWESLCQILFASNEFIYVN